jgi:hypothetical protein
MTTAETNQREHSMSTGQTKQRTSTAFEAPLEQLEGLGEQMLSTARKASTKYLDSYEKAVDRAIDLELKLAGMTQQEWVKGMIDTHVEMTRELTEAYTSAARQLLR